MRKRPGPSRRPGPPSAGGPGLVGADIRSPRERAGVRARNRPAGSRIGLDPVSTLPTPFFTDKTRSYPRFFPMSFRLATLVAASLAVAVSPVLRADAASDPTVAAVVSESRAVTAARFPNADTAVIAQDQRVTLDADGGYVRTSVTRTKALTEKGRRDLLTYSTGFNLSYGTIKVTALRILKPTGEIVTLDIAKQTAVQQDPSSMSANIYDPNDRRLVASIPGVAIGDIVEVAIEEKTRAIMKGCFADIVTLEGDAPALHTRYVVVTPKSLPLARITVKDGDDTGIAHTKTEKDGMIEYVWEVGETPQIIPEPEMPAPYLCVRRLLVSTVPDWSAISKWYWSISEPHYTITPEIRKQTDDLLKGMTDREERIRAIYRFVSQEIRYMGVIDEHEAPGFEPHDVALTFGKRYGVCRDKAALLAVMLRAAGFKSYPVLINAGSRVDPDAFGLYFNHAITAIGNEDGTYRLLDSTNESTKDIFPAYLANCSYLVANPDGDTLHVAPVPDASANLVTGETKLVVGRDGSVTGTTVIEFGGINDTLYRGGLAQAKPDDIRRFVQNKFSASIPGARVTDVAVEPGNMLDTNVALKFRVGFTAPDFLVSRDGKALLKTPFVAAAFGFATEQLGGATSLEKRRFPIRLAILAGVRERVTVTLPDSVGETLALPGDKTLDDANLKYSRTFVRDGATLTGIVDLRLKRLDIPAAEYAELRTDLREISRAGKRAALLATAPDVTPDSRVLSRRTEVTVADAGSVTVRTVERRKVLTYAGKKDNAELKLEWNTTNPEPVLERAVVTDRAGVRHEVSPKEINILDAGWVASAPRYAPSRIKVVALPSVEEGAEIETARSQTYRNLTSVFWNEVFADTDIVDAEEVTIVAPDSLPLFLDNRAGAVVTKADGKVTIAVKRRLAPIPKEPAVAPGKTWAPTLAFSTLADDTAYAAILRGLLADKCVPDAAVKAKAAELVAGATSDDAKLVALRDFVAKDIRQAGPGWGETPPATLAGAARTLADRYGNGADRALLFVALARAAGYDAVPALFATDDLAVAVRRPSDPFTAGFYSGLGARVRPASGAPVDFAYFNQYADIRTNAGAGDSVLPLDTGKPETVKTDVDGGSSEYAITLSDNGDAALAYTSLRTGQEASGFTAWVAELTPEERSRYFQSVISGLSRDAKAVGDLRLEKGRVGKLAYDAAVADFAVVQGRYAYFDLPGGAGDVFGGANTPTRKLPYAVAGRRDQVTRWTVTLPKGWKLASDATGIDWSGPAGTGLVKLDIAETVGASGVRTLVYEKRIALRAGVVSPAAYPALVELNRRMRSPEIWRVLLERE